MPRARKVTAPKKKAAAAVETHDSIAEQVDDFLKSGNKIQKIPSGVSGVPSMGKKHIVLGKK